MENKKEIRVRMAPSPTGTLHVGTARTTLFNYLFARSQGGTFVMRIEDTDTERSRPEYEENILKGLSWLGMEWDEGPLPEGGERGTYGPYRQSARGELYRAYLEKMLAAGTAFYCWHTTDELQAEQAEQTERKEAPRHNCSYRDAQDEHASTNPNAIIRFKNDHSGAISFTDAIKGEISFSAAGLGDFSIAKSLDSALYNFAVVVDDFEMKISHVIRGEDHISNTPKQLLLQEALGFEHPEYAHLPLLLGSDRSKLSKR
ncbi:MAG: glutamate--tRNA ligase, partial [Candidatus Spechtbacterales bacterium]